ncbi:MAG: hypothetical protein ACI9GH_000400 [Candidatus Paceibacteria bacterium]
MKRQIKKQTWIAKYLTKILKIRERRALRMCRNVKDSNIKEIRKSTPDKNRLKDAFNITVVTNTHKMIPVQILLRWPNQTSRPKSNYLVINNNSKQEHVERQIKKITAGAV